LKDEKEIIQLLVQENYLSLEDAKQAWAYSRKDKMHILEYLKRHEILTNDVLRMALAEYYGMGYVNFDTRKPSNDEVTLVPQDFAQAHRVVVYKKTEDLLILATDEPTQENLSEELNKLYRDQAWELRYALSEQIDEALINYRKSLELRFFDIIERGKNVAPTIIDAIVKDAAAVHASDIHFEPELKEVSIRMRVDGVLQDSGSLKLDIYQSILNRIKIMARLRIDEHNSVQDGAISYDNEEIGSVDMRISITPTISGEKIVIRLLTAHGADFTLGDLGLNSKDQQLIENMGKKPFGMIVVTGPTGSGKTTTLYSLMKFINTREINITTIEDPVEYNIPGIAQIQVNPQTNLTFGEGLRSIVRQDPDVILVGEIRDSETAEIAVNAALTGHLMLTTFHANDAATAIPRLLDLGTEPFLVASTLEMVVAQRLVRKVCQSCRVGSKVDIKNIVKDTGINKTDALSLKSQLTVSQTVTLYKGKGCNVCNGTGYKGRIGLFEIIVLNDDIKELILSRPSSNEIWKLAKKTNSKTLFEDGLEKVKQGETTIEELLRIVPVSKNI
jgi:general secretion pathway protein E